MENVYSTSLLVLTYGCNRGDQVVVTQQRAPWPAAEQTSRIGQQREGDTKRRGDSDQCAAVSGIDNGAWNYISRSEHHVDGGAYGGDGGIKRLSYNGGCTEQQGETTATGKRREDGE